MEGSSEGGMKERVGVCSQVVFTTPPLIRCVCGSVVDVM